MLATLVALRRRSRAASQPSGSGGRNTGGSARASSASASPGSWASIPAAAQPGSE